MLHTHAYVHIHVRTRTCNQASNVRFRSGGVEAVQGGATLLAVGGGDPHIARAGVEEDAEGLLVLVLGYVVVYDVCYWGVLEGEVCCCRREGAEESTVTISIYLNITYTNVNTCGGVPSVMTPMYCESARLCRATLPFRWPLVLVLLLL